MSKQEHPYAKVLRWIADGESIQADSYSYGQFLDVMCTKTLLEGIAEGRASDPERFRLKPRTITINGIEVPEPLRVAPEEGSDYFTVNMEDGDADSWRLEWRSGGLDSRRLNAGLCHATREAAEIHARALLSFTTQEAK